MRKAQEEVGKIGGVEELEVCWGIGESVPYLDSACACDM